jgi:uncharacterized membrane protein YdjX (TVP38/TMEM64 family)
MPETQSQIPETIPPPEGSPAPSTPALACRKCGFSLEGLAAGASCPECGREIRPADLNPDEALGATIKRMGPAAWLAFAWTVLPGLLSVPLWIRMPVVADWFRGHAPGSLGLAGFGLLPTVAQAVLAGFAFGIHVGLAAALTGFVGASLVGYALARRAAQHRVEAEIERRPRFKAVRDALVGGSFWKTVGIVALVRTPPNSPFALTNWLLAATETKLLPAILGTAIGMTPRTLAAVAIGAKVSSLSQRPETPRWLIAAGIASVIVVIIVIGWIANRALDRLTRASTPTPDA